MKEILRQQITAERLADYVSRKKLEQDGFKKEFEVTTVLFRTASCVVDF